MCALAGIMYDRKGAIGLEELVGNLLRGSISSIMYVILLFTLTRSRVGRKATIVFVAAIYLLDIAMTLWFYLYGDLTALSRFSVLMLLVTALAIKPLTRLNFMQWCFTFLTTTNIAMMIIILSFHLGKLFPYPQYANTILRFLLYLGVILIFRKFLLPSYRSVVANWPIFSGLMTIIFLNLSYYFFVTDDIQRTLTVYRWPLLLMVALSIAAYGTVFHALHKYAAMYAMESENRRMQEESNRLQETAMQLERHANHDMLTGLPNRRFFFKRLDGIVGQSHNEKRTFALLYIDLDGFKDINDTHGHEIGDQILKVVGNRLSECVRDSDFVARLGGDEFAVIIRDIADEASVMPLVTRLQAKLHEVVQIEHSGHLVSASIGIALYPVSGSDGQTLVRHADAAMYEAKHNMSGGICIFSDRTRETTDPPLQA